MFHYREVLGIRLGDFGDIVVAKRPKRLPVVLTQTEVLAILALLDGANGLACALLSAIEDHRSHLSGVEKL